MTRKDDLLKIFEKADKQVLTIVSPMIDELIFIEGQLEELKKYPFVKYHPKNPALQKPTPAGRMYKDLIGQQKDIIRILCSQLNKAEQADGDSPLRDFFREWEYR